MQTLYDFGAPNQWAYANPIWYRSPHQHGYAGLFPQTYVKVRCAQCQAFHQKHSLGQAWRVRVWTVHTAKAQLHCWFVLFCVLLFCFVLPCFEVCNSSPVALDGLVKDLSWDICWLCDDLLAGRQLLPQPCTKRHCKPSSGSQRHQASNQLVNQVNNHQAGKQAINQTKKPFAVTARSTLLDYAYICMQSHAAASYATSTMFQNCD